MSRDVNWDGVNWDRSNEELAELLGVSESVVRRLRRRPSWAQRRRRWIEQWMVDNREAAAQLTDYKIAELVAREARNCVSVATIRRVRKGLRIAKATPSIATRAAQLCQTLGWVSIDLLCESCGYPADEYSRGRIANALYKHGGFVHYDNMWHLRRRADAQRTEVQEGPAQPGPD
jgi:hypothetical protein